MSGYHLDPIFFPEKDTFERNAPSVEALPELEALLYDVRVAVERLVRPRYYEEYFMLPRSHFEEQRRSWRLPLLFNEPAMQQLWLPDLAHIDKEVLAEVSSLDESDIMLPNDFRRIANWCAQERVGGAIHGVPDHDCARPGVLKAHRNVVGRSLSMLGLHYRVVRYRLYLRDKC